MIGVHARHRGATHAALVATLLICARAHAQVSQGYRVIVNPANPITEVDRDYLANVFLKRITRWPNSELIRPVDQNADAVVRRRFTEHVMGRSVSAIRNAWEQAIFAGRDVPPPELDSDEAVVSYVLRNPGAVGYVSTQANVDGARVLQVR